MDGISKLPRYVLKDGVRSIGPFALSGLDVAQVSSIYGFTDKAHYDAFLKNSPGLLTPYPLVRGFLQNRIDSEPHALQLVALDSTDPNQPMLYAVTMQSIVAAISQEQSSIPVSHTLTLIESSNSYRVTNCPQTTAPETNSIC